MWKYRGSNRLVQLGDTVRVSQRIATLYGNGNPQGTVVDLRGFITVQMTTTGDRVDLDSRSVTHVSSPDCS